MKQNQKRNIITAIQNNLKQMQLEAQQFLDKHHGSNLPPICSARHYLFHTIPTTNVKEKELESGILLGKDRGRDEQMKSINLEKESEKDKNIFKPRTSIYNLEFTKKIKAGQPHTVLPMNSTSLRLRMSGNWRAHRYMENQSSRTSLQSNSSPNDKMKTIVMNSEVIDRADKDLKLSNNLFSPKMSKLNLPKKQSEVLQKYLSKFKEYKEEQNPQLNGKLQQLANKSTNLLQNVLPNPENDHCNKRRSIKLCKNILIKNSVINGQQSGRIRNRSTQRMKLKLEKELLQLPRYQSLNKKGSKVDLERELAVVDADCTPWSYGEKGEEGGIGYDFS